MNTDQYLAFMTELLKKQHITSCILTDPQHCMPSEIDGGLRAMLFEQPDYSRLLRNSPVEAKDRVIYRFFDEYLCHYIFFRIPGSDHRYFFAGPYISSLPSEEFYEKKADQLSLDSSKTDQMRNYYRNLPLIEDENILLGMMDALGIFIFGGENHFTTEFVDYEIPDQRKPIYTAGIFDTPEPAKPGLTLEIIEQNYINEKILMDAVSNGKLHKLDIITASLLHQGTEERLKDSLRNRKNYLIILNTLLRKAAEYGAVHPYHIHRLSSQFAKKIEAVPTIKSSLDLQREMMRKYCLLVKEHSLKKYSSLIGRVITLISYDLSADLSLKRIAALMNVNASYLSAAFKKECGETLTSYVNRKRMEAAAFTLAHSDRQIQAISAEYGLLDVNYFIKLFKKEYGMTPSQYRSFIIHP